MKIILEGTESETKEILNFIYRRRFPAIRTKKHSEFIPEPIKKFGVKMEVEGKTEIEFDY